MEKGIWIIKSICVTMFSCIVFGLTTSNILPLLVGALYSIIICKYDIELKHKEYITVKILSFFYSIAIIYANIERVLGFAGILSIISLFVCFTGAYFSINIILNYLVVLFRKDSLIVCKSRKIEKKNVWLAFGLSLLFILLCWGVGLAFSYPGNFNRDGRWILWQVTGIEDYSVANPIIHTVMTDIFWNIGQALFGTPNGSVATICTAQFTFGALIVSYMVSRLYAYNVKKWICVIVVLFYALTPYNVQLMHTIWSDMPFAICTLWFITLLWEEERATCELKKISYLMHQVLFVIAGVCMCLTRTNGYYAFLLFLPFGIVLFWKTKKYIVVELLMIIVLCNWIRGPVYDNIINRELMNKVSTQEETGSDDTVIYKAENATRSHNSVAYYILTAQQLARVVVDRTLTVEEQEELSRIFDINQVKEEYIAERSDPVLHLVNKQMPISEYLSIWFRYGIKYPFSYLLAWRDSTYAYWYPDVQDWIYSDAVRENEMGIYKDSILSDESWLKLQQYETLYLDIPIYGMIWSIGFVVWVVLFAMGLTFIKRGWKKCLLFMPLMGIWVSLLIASPVNSEFRYLYSFFLCLPLMILIPFLPDNEKNQKSC